VSIVRRVASPRRSSPLSSHNEETANGSRHELGLVPTGDFVSSLFYERHDIGAIDRHYTGHGHLI
jgi:hypothetical protein